MEKTCPGYVEGSLACPSYRGKSQLLIRISLQNVTNCCMRNKTLARLFRWPGHPPSLANFSPCKHFNSPWLGEVNWPNARQSFRACVRALSALSFGQKVDLFSSPIKQPTFRDATGKRSLSCPTGVGAGIQSKRQEKNKNSCDYN